MGTSGTNIEVAADPAGPYQPSRSTTSSVGTLERRQTRPDAPTATTTWFATVRPGPKLGFDDAGPALACVGGDEAGQRRARDGDVEGDRPHR